MKLKFYLFWLLILTARMVLGQSPVVTSIVPVSGPIGTLVHITGSNLASPTQFMIGGVDALAISNDGNNLVGMVMPGAASGTINITNSGGGINAGSFTITAPQLPTQQVGQKIVPSDVMSDSGLGYCTKVSADGETIVVGAPSEGSWSGAIWIYEKYGDNWTKKTKITNPGTQGPQGGTSGSQFGVAVDISADGKTVVAGAPYENARMGAVYVFNRSDQGWKLEQRLFPDDASPYPYPKTKPKLLFGFTASISADGNTILTGAPMDQGGNNAGGAAWIFTNSNNGWKQLGYKIAGPVFELGSYGDLSADGKTALLIDDGTRGRVYVNKNGIWSFESNLDDNGLAIFIGAGGAAISANGDVAVLGGGANYTSGNNTYHEVTGAFVFERINGIWTGPTKLVPSQQMWWVSMTVDISADGKTVVLGDDNGVSSGDNTWVYAKQGQQWILKTTLHSSDAIGHASQSQCSISADGQTIVVGGNGDNNGAGAFWAYSTPTITLMANTPHGTRTSEVLLPITVKNFTNILSAQLEVNWDPVVATFVDVEGMGIASMDQSSFGTSQVNTGKLTLSWFDPALAPQTLSDGTVLFNIRFKLTGPYNASTAVTLKNAELSQQGNPHAVTVNVTTQDGSVSIDPSLTANGKVTYANNNTVQNVQLDLTGSSTQSTTTDATGQYSFTLTPQTLTENYTFTPSKAADATDIKNNIDVADVYIIHQHILQNQLITDATQLKAADVDQNGIISTIDLVYIQSLILGKSTSYPGNALWVFTPASIDASLSELEASPSEDFTSFMLGDVTFDWGKPAGGRTAATTAQPFDIRQEMLVNEEQHLIEIPVRAKDFREVSGYQFTVSWDAANLEYKGVVNKSLNSVFGEHQTANGKLTVLWDGADGRSQTLLDKQELFALQFITHGGSYQDVTITSDITPAKAIDKDLTGHGITTVWSELDKEDYSQATSIYPNPFGTNTTIEFYSEEASFACVQIRDELGREVRTLCTETKKGLNKMVWDGRDNHHAELATGLYIVDVFAGRTNVKVKVMKR